MMVANAVRHWYTCWGWRILVCAALLAGLLATACSDPTAQRPPAPPTTGSPAPPAGAGAAQSGTPAPAARAYLDAALALMRAHALHRELIDWPTLRASTYTLAAAAQTPADTYGAIRYAVGNLYDGHSFFRTPDEVSQYRNGQTRGYGLHAIGETIVLVWSASPAARAGVRVGDRIVASSGASGTADGPLALTLARGGASTPRKVTLHQAVYSTNRPPIAHALETGIGYLELPGFDGVETADAYAARAHAALRTMAPAVACGWIVDLRRNTGGNAWAMFAAVGPLLGDGQIGGEVVGAAHPVWSYGDGQARYDGNAMVQVPDPLAVLQPQPPVAVLTSALTASAGEAVTVAFRGRAATRSFGEATYGIPSVVQGYQLDDGAWLELAVGHMADRTGQTYEGPITPDENVVIDWATLDTERDAVVDTASVWLREQAPCTP